MLYKTYGIENDMWNKKRKHIYYLIGNIETKGIIVATYSLKTNKLLIRCDSKHIPATQILISFVKYCENKGE